MSEPNDPQNLEIESLSDDDLESVSGGAVTTTGGTCNSTGGSCTTSSGTCNSGGGICTTTGGTCTEKKVLS